jgi:hypothetical protein
MMIPAATSKHPCSTTGVPVVLTALSLSERLVVRKRSRFLYADMSCTHLWM